VSVTETASPLPGRMWRLDPVPAAAGQARGRLRTTLARWGVDESTAADAELVLGELVSNAVVASRQVPGRPPPIGVSLAVTLAALTIEVLDRAPGTPVLLSAVGTDEGGRGLSIVEALTGGRWGSRPGIAPGTKFVWAEISLNPSGEQPGAPDEPHPQKLTTGGTMPAAKPCLPDSNSFLGRLKSFLGSLPVVQFLTRRAG
jgi:anti-sigma regulatory factor (Ser/Thr protein kinase)